MGSLFVVGVAIVAGRRLEWVLTTRDRAAASENPLLELLRSNFRQWRYFADCSIGESGRRIGRAVLFGRHGEENGGSAVGRGGRQKT